MADIDPTSSTIAEVSGAQPATLVLAGELEDADALRTSIRAASDGFARPLRVDLSAVTYLPSVVIGVLFGSMQAAEQAGTTLEVVMQSGSLVERILHITAMPHTVT